MNDDLKYLKKQHILNYKNNALQIILNNNNSLFDEDIMSLFKKPPLESMDLIKNKLISITKKYNIIINTDNYNDIDSKYRERLSELCNKIKKVRLDSYNDIVNSFNFDNNNNEVIKLLKKDTIVLDKEIRKEFKTGIVEAIDNSFLEKFDKLFVEEPNDKIMDDIIDKFEKFINKYLKQLLENIDIKILVKDTILINSIKEEGDKYLYTLNNSHLFD